MPPADDTTQFVAKLRSELDWLRREYPIQAALIFVAESYLRTVEQAASTKSFTFTPTSVDWAAILVKGRVPTSE